MQSNAYWAILAALVLGQSGCTSLLGQRYFDGAEFACAECEQAPQLAGEAGVVPPHSRYHPVPTRPVFSPQPQAVTVTVATHSALVSEEKVAQRAEVKKPTQRVARAPVTAPTAPNLRTAGAIQRWMSETEPSMAAKPVASGASSRRAAADDPELASAPLPADDRDVFEATPLPSPAPVATPSAWTDRFQTSDGWRPRVAR